MSGIMMALLGSVGLGVVNPLPGGSASDTQANPTHGITSWRFNVDGTVDRLQQVTRVHVHDWFVPTGGTPGNSYWIRLTVISGTTPAGAATATWLALSSAREWILDENVVGTIQGTYTVEIASDAAGTNIVASSAAGGYTLFSKMLP